MKTPLRFLLIPILFFALFSCTEDEPVIVNNPPIMTLIPDSPSIDGTVGNLIPITITLSGESAFNVLNLHRTIGGTTVTEAVVPANLETPYKTPFKVDYEITLSEDMVGKPVELKFEYESHHTTPGGGSVVSSGSKSILLNVRDKEALL